MMLIAGFGRWLTLLAGLVVLSSCVVEEGPRPPGGGRGGPVVCTMEYDPVCGRRFGERRTFSNACAAEAAGFDVIRRGQCRSGVAVGGDRPRFCTRQYRPVCARRGPQVQTFGNACMAEVEGFRVIAPGAC